jgi:rhamnose utilization protein RhaD (predicted bifunctional aldolase and dehydrogenase)
MDYTEAINKSKIVDTSERPSMEVGLHAALQNLGQAVLHTHPLCLNSILCSKQAGSIIGNLYNKFNYVFIPYITPGHELSNMVSNKNLYEALPVNSSATVIFMQNHGLVVVCDSLKECVAVTKEINEISRHFLNQRLRMQAPEQSRRIWYSQPGEHLFPDSVVLAKETMFAHAYVFNNILQAGLIPRCLSDSDVNKLLKLESEKYRREIE